MIFAFFKNLIKSESEWTHFFLPLLFLIMVFFIFFSDLQFLKNIFSSSQKVELPLNHSAFVLKEPALFGEFDSRDHLDLGKIEGIRLLGFSLAAPYQNSTVILKNQNGEEKTYALNDCVSTEICINALSEEGLTLIQNGHLQLIPYHEN